MEVEAEEQVARPCDGEVAKEPAVLVEDHHVAGRIPPHLEIRRVDVAVSRIDGEAFRVGAIRRKPREGHRLIAVEGEGGDEQQQRENECLTHLHRVPPGV